MKRVNFGKVVNIRDSEREPLNKKERQEIKGNGTYPYIGANGIVDWVDEYLFDEKILCIAEDGGSWGKNEVCTQIFNQKCWVNNHAHVVTAKENVLTEYLSYYLNYQDLNSFITGTTRGKLNQTNLKKIEIPLPSLSEQKAIVAKLDRAQRLIDIDKEMLAKYDELIQSVFLEMFGDPVTNPKGWHVTTIGEVCDVKGGKRVPKGQSLQKKKTNHPYIKAQNIKSGKVTLKDLEYLSKDLAIKLSRYTVQKEDVCITVVGANIGDVGIVPSELDGANLTENANKLLIKNKNKLTHKYLAHYMMSEYVEKQIYQKTMAVGVPKLAIFRIKDIEIVIPKMEAQNSFSSYIEKVETSKNGVRISLKKSEELFSSLVQGAFG